VSTGTILIVAGAFLACAVEMVEALTIVLGVGVVRGWRSTLIGAGAAGFVLALLVAALGPALGSIPIDTLRLVVGALLLAFGLQWLRKAILRSSGFKDLHDEDAAYRAEREQAAAAGDERRLGLDWYSFTVAFKGVLLEGLEVVFIVIAFGAAQGDLGLAVAGAAAALVTVVVAGAFELARVDRVLVVQVLVAARAQDRLAQPLQAEDQEQRADDEPEDVDRDERQRRPERGDDRQEHDRGRGHADEGGAPAPGDAGREHDREGLDRLHRAREEGGQDQEDRALAHSSRA